MLEGTQAIIILRKMKVLANHAAQAAFILPALGHDGAHNLFFIPCRLWVFGWEGKCQGLCAKTPTLAHLSGLRSQDSMYLEHPLCDGITAEKYHRKQLKWKTWQARICLKFMINIGRMTSVRP